MGLYVPKNLFHENKPVDIIHSTNQYLKSYILTEQQNSYKVISNSQQTVDILVYNGSLYLSLKLKSKTLV